MRIAFRADASREMGIGHVMRCLTIAESMKARGARTRFISRGLSPSLRRLVLDAGHDFADLPRPEAPATEPTPPHAVWLGTSQAADAQATIAALGESSYDWMVVDHYAIDYRWETAVRVVAERCFAIDDLADRVHETEMLLDQNIMKGMDSRYARKVPEGCRMLLGPRYALLRREFLEAGGRAERRTGAIHRILVFFGGGDANDNTSRAIDGVVAAGLGVAVDVVIGAEHPNRAGVEDRCVTHGFTCHVSTTRMADLMSAADFSIGAGGSASWERCFLGLPTLCFATADNQVAISRGLADAGAVALGDESSVADCVSAVLKRLARGPSEVLAMSDRAQHLVDGRGTERVCDALSEVA